MTNEQKFLVDCIIDDVANYLIEDNGYSILEALEIIYNSQFYEKLMDMGTGLYFQGSAYNYEFLKQELKYGKVA